MQSGAGQSGIFGFNKSKARIVSPNSPKITFDNLKNINGIYKQYR